MNQHEQLRRRHDGSIDTDFYARRALLHRAIARREALTGVVKLIAGMVRNWSIWTGSAPLMPHRGR